MAAGPKNHIKIDIDGRKVFTDVARTIGLVDRNIPRQFLRVFEAEAKFLKKEAGAKVLQEPSEKHHKPPRLRKEISKGLFVYPSMDSKYGIGYGVGTSMPTEDQAFLPRGMDWRLGWRHPVFSTMEAGPVVEQHGAFSWFLDTMDQAKDHVEPKLKQIFDDGAETIDDAAH